MKFKLLHFEINKILLFSLLGILLMCSVASAVITVDYTEQEKTELNTTINNVINVYGGGSVHIWLSNYTYNVSDTLANAAMYGKQITTGTANLGGAPKIGDKTTQLLYPKHICAIRQTGLIEYVEFDCVNPNLVGTYKINIWRYNGVTYDLVSQSEDLKTQLVPGMNNISVSLYAHEGDFIGESNCFLHHYSFNYGCRNYLDV